MPQEIHTTNIPVELVETNQFGEEKVLRATIEEIYMDSLGNPYQVVINYNGKSRRITPVFGDGVITFRTRYREYTGFIAEG